MVKPGAAVLDVGVSRVDGKIAGDVADDVWDVAGWVSPNPGGVGPMTRAMLLSNIVAIAEQSPWRERPSSRRSASPTPDATSRCRPEPRRARRATAARRYPSTIGGAFYLVVLAVVAVGDRHRRRPATGASASAGSAGRCSSPRWCGWCCRPRRRHARRTPPLVGLPAARRRRRGADLPGRLDPRPAASDTDASSGADTWSVRSRADSAVHDGAGQIRPSSVTASRSSASSAVEASIRAREKSSISRPWTISQSPSLVVTGKEEIRPSGTP